MKYSIIGTGLQFERRLKSINALGEDTLISVFGDSAEDKLGLSNFAIDRNWQETVERKDVELIIIATPPHLHFEIAKNAIANGKHILIEKPLTQNLEQALDLYKLCNNGESVIKCGFNHRYHPAIKEAFKIVSSDWKENVKLFRGVYGIGGRDNYHNEWRANPLYAAGGQFIEQGSHLIDLANWFIGPINSVLGVTENLVFKKKVMEDTGVAILKNSINSIATIESTLLQWKNLFRIEIFTEGGYLEIQGLGGSYGNQILKIGRREESKPFSEQVTHFRKSDNTWTEEWLDFKRAIQSGNQPSGGIVDGINAMIIATAVYKSSELGVAQQVNLF